MLMIAVYNYIMACVGVMLFRKVDEFHFGVSSPPPSAITRVLHPPSPLPTL